MVVRPAFTVAHALARFDDHVLDRAVHAVAGAVPRIARAAAQVDDRVLDPGIETTAAAAEATGRAAAQIDDAGIDATVEGVAARIRRLGQLARAPQTGAIHQYLFQAVAVLAIGVAAYSVYAVMG